MSSTNESTTIEQVGQREQVKGERWRKSVRDAGRRIAFAREEAGWSQERLAEKVGTDKGTISRIEKGKVLNVAAGFIFDICEALAQDPSYVWTGIRRRYGSSHPPESAERPSQPPVRK